MKQHDISGICPGCGHTIHVPGELERFSCVYCGQRLTPAELLPQPVEQQADVHALDALSRELAEAVISHPGALEHLTSKGYPTKWESYLEQYRPVFQKVAPVCGGSNPNTEELAEQVVALLKEWSERARSGPLTREGRLDELKFTLCLFTIPGIRAMEQPGCEKLALALRQAWCRVFPKKPFQLTTARDIMDGFQPRKLCFITTAICRQAGKPDDCPELTAFRRFRDGYLAHLPQGPALIAEYYRLAPRIVLAVELCHDPDTLWAQVRREHLEPCYEALCQGNNATCLERYGNMVRCLERRYLGRLPS